MELVLGMVVGLALGMASLAIDRRWGRKVGFAVAVALVAVVSLLVAATELSVVTFAGVMSGFSVPNLVREAVGTARRPPHGPLRPR